MKIQGLSERGFILAFVLLYALIYLFFYPPFYVTTDEHEYLYNSYLIQKNSLVLEDKTLTPFGKFNGKGYISAYYIGKSIFLIPFTWLGWRVVFLSGLFTHLLNVYIFLKVLQRLRIPTANALLFLFYPAFYWNSRTLGNENLVLTGVLAAFYFYISEGKRNWTLSGAMFGAAVLVRYETLLAFLAFAAAALLRDREKFRYMTLGFIPFAIFILVFNNAYYGGWFGVGYNIARATASGLGQRTPEFLLMDIFKYSPNFFPNLSTYIILLLIVYPLMILAPLFYKYEGKNETLLALLAYLLLYSRFTGVSTYSILSPVSLTAQLRYFIPIIGLLLVPYASLYEKILDKSRIPPKPFLYSVIFLLFVGSVYMSSIHYEFQKGREAVFQQIYENTEEGSLMLGTVDDGIYVMPGVFGDRRYLGIDTHKIYGTEDIEPYMNNKTYVIYLKYKTQLGEHPRTKKVLATREKAKEFIDANRNSLQLVFNTTEPHYLEIYKWKG